MSLPGFTADFALSNSSRSYWRPQTTRTDKAAAVQPELINTGGGASNYLCDPEGTCSCLGGSLSDDCWLMQQWCTNPLNCDPYPPYKCSCSWKMISHPPRWPLGPRWWSGGKTNVYGR